MKIKKVLSIENRELVAKKENVSLVATLNEYLDNDGLQDVRHFLEENEFAGVVWNDNRVTLTDFAKNILNSC